MHLGQVHEQNNKLVKGSSGAVELTENPTAIRRWMISGPEQARLLKEFESLKLTDWEQQHEQCHSIQAKTGAQFV